MTLLEITSTELASSFDNKGYDLIMENREADSLSVEESIVAALLKQSPRLIEGIPILLAKNKINYSELGSLVKEYNLWNEFGYFGEFTLKHVQNKKLTKLVSSCHHHLKPSAYLDNSFPESSKTFQKPEEILWNLIGAPPYTGLEKQFNRYVKNG